MALSAAAPSLNRFPGLTLKAWAFINGTTVVQGFNVASVTSSSGSTTVNFTNPIAGGLYALDVSAARETAYTYSATANSCMVFFRDATGANTNPSAPYFLAFYG